MRLCRDVPMLAAVMTVAGVSAPAALALDNKTLAGGDPTVAVVQHRQSNSTDWVLSGLVAVGAITLAAAGLGASRGLARPVTSVISGVSATDGGPRRHHPLPRLTTRSGRHVSQRAASSG